MPIPCFNFRTCINRWSANLQAIAHAQSKLIRNSGVTKRSGHAKHIKGSLRVIKEHWPCSKFDHGPFGNFSHFPLFPWLSESRTMATSKADCLKGSKALWLIITIFGQNISREKTPAVVDKHWQVGLSLTNLVAGGCLSVSVVSSAGFRTHWDSPRAHQHRSPPRPTRRIKKAAFSKDLVKKGQMAFQQENLHLDGSCHPGRILI